MPEHLRPALELAKRLMANGERPETSDDEAQTTLTSNEMTAIFG